MRLSLYFNIKCNISSINLLYIIILIKDFKRLMKKEDIANKLKMADQIKMQKILQEEGQEHENKSPKKTASHEIFD